MSRIIKFRAWYKGQMVYFNAYKRWGFINHAFDDSHACLGGDEVLLTTNPEITQWMQFTGLRDREDTEIYEGDIVKWGDFPKEHFGYEIEVRIATVRIDPDIQFDCRNIRHPFIFHFGSFAYRQTEKYLTVVGNIYENPEPVETSAERATTTSSET